MRCQFLMAAFFCTMAVAAQSPVEVQQQAIEKSHRIFYMGDKSESDTLAQQELLRTFYMDQFIHSRDPRAPYFLLMSHNGSMAMGVGGKIEGIASYDWHGSVPGTGFAPYDISIPMDAAEVNSFQTSIGHTALFFTVFGNNTRFGAYKLYIEAKFTGAHQTFKLSKAYATVGDWTLGYTKSSFVDPASQPSTIETQGPNSEVDDTRFLLRYMHTFGKMSTIAISAEQPDNTVDAVAGINKGGSSPMPDFAALVQYGKSDQHIRLSAIVKNMRYRNLVEGSNHYLTGWGVNLTTVFRPVAPLTVYAAVNTGQGIGSMVNDLGEGVNDIISFDGTSGKMVAPRSYGWYAALQYNYRPNVFSTVIVSQERILPKHDAVWGPDDYKYGLYGTANLFWEIVPRCQLGAEINVGKRSNMDGAHRMAYRADLMASFSF